MRDVAPKTQAAYQQACQVLVGGVNSPVRSFRTVGGTPVFIHRAEGPYLFDLDGRRFIDLICSWGANIVGHAHPRIVGAVTDAAACGLSFGACCLAETQLARMIIDAVPGIELLRFVNSGTEAVMSAIRLARAVTGRSKIIKFAGCYHGHADALLVSAGSGASTFGVPDSAGVLPAIAAETLVANYNNLDSVRALIQSHGHHIAAILVEPVAGNMGFVPPIEGFLQGLRELCDQSGALLIFDEVMTGFRTARGGYQSICGIRPDITCLGKVIGGGMPVAAYGASRSIMSAVSPLGPMYQAGTLSGNPVAMAAGIATLELCTDDLYKTLAACTAALCEGLRVAADKAGIAIQTDRCGGLFGLAFSPTPIRDYEDARRADHALYARFFHAMLERGVLLPPSGFEAMFVSVAHVSVIDDIIAAAADAFGSLR